MNSASSLDPAFTREWLETNGLGGYASSTLAGLNTRRYHGLLIAATTPPTGRVVLLSKLEETLVLNGQRYELSANQYPGVIHPRGFEFLEDFRREPFPVFVYRVAGVEIAKRVFMVHGENTTVIEYQLRGADHADCTLEVRPLLAVRDYHSLTRQNGFLNAALRIEPGMVSTTPYPDHPTLHFGHNATTLEPSGEWYFNFEYRAEQERGLDCQEDLFQPFVLRFDLRTHATATVIASTSPHHAHTAAALQESECQRRAAIVAMAPCDVSDVPLVKTLTAAADAFLVQRGAGKTIVAGYHWFTDWGRDTMIALPGLTLVTRRFEIAKDILHHFAGFLDQGMLPNRFPDVGETPEYNTADATLWFFEAIRAYLQATGDAAFVHTLYPQLQDIIDWHIRGTRFGIHVDTDGLLACGQPGTQLTWMDAKIGDFVVTPRIGKPVEIQALWYNALRVMEELAGRFGEAARQASYRRMADAARHSFNAQFWNAAAGCLYDVVGPDGADASLRPNQIFAVSLPHSMLDYGLAAERARGVVETVRRELLTPLGLRTLSPRDPRYRGRYEGGVRERDTAYHMGTVWPWLLGPFLTAYLKVNPESAAARRQCQEWLEGVGQICEIADGDFPHTPRGCIAQAWSVAELLRAATAGYCLDGKINSQG